MQVDREAWSRIVVNLVSNAVKYTETGGVTVHLSATQTGVRLEVTDTGVGISDAERAAVFERFHRAEGARGRDSRGLGVGLSLVEDLVRAHFGTVNVRSRLGEGSTRRGSEQTWLVRLRPWNGCSARRPRLRRRSPTGTSFRTVSW